MGMPACKESFAKTNRYFPSEDNAEGEIDDVTGNGGDVEDIPVSPPAAPPDATGSGDSGVVD
jgi:hypothetical protein